jgi:hypothetical protein
MQVTYKKSPNYKGNKLKKEIPLLTLLANESTHNSRKLLEKYKKDTGVNHVDLENKLANLYETTKDKATLEKEFAEIHPHRDFIINALDLVPKQDIQISETIKKEIVAEPKKQEISVSYGNADGASESTIEEVKPVSKQLQKEIVVIGVVGVVALAALSITVIYLTKKS